MQRYSIAVLFGVMVAIASFSAAATTTTCPVPDVQAAVSQACPCSAARNHGQYMKCVRKQLKGLRKQGCDVAKAARCTATSICGKPHNPVVCCKGNGRAKIVTAAKCTERGGTPSTATSLCDATCPTP